jgi:hypothetical protein
MEGAGRVGHLPAEPLHEPARALHPLRSRRDLLRLAEQVQQQRVVVEHLLEVRHPPEAVHAVAVEASAELVVDSPRDHPIQRVERPVAQRDVAGAPPRPEQHCEIHRVRELGRAPEATLDRIERPCQ